MMEAANTVAASPQGFDPRAPYAAQWKEFDKLSATANDGAIVADYVVVALGVLGAMAADLYTGRHSGLIIGVVPALIGAAFAVRVKRRRSRFEHWPCPRRRAEWPGNKYEKVPQCPSCGLKLHQMAP